MVVDTQNGAGTQIRNKIPVRLKGGRLGMGRGHHLADIFVEDPLSARNEIGTLIMDFGNTGSAFIFSRSGAGPLQSLGWCRRTNALRPPLPASAATQEGNILRSNMIVLRVGPQRVRGRRGSSSGAEPRSSIQDHPLWPRTSTPRRSTCGTGRST